MYIFKNAMRSIARAKGRNILIGMIVLVIAISACVALSINESSKKAKESTLANMEITAQISFDRTSMMNNQIQNDSETLDRSKMREIFAQSDSLTIEELQTYANADCVKGFYYTLTTSLSGDDNLEPVDETETTSDTAEEDSLPFFQNENNRQDDPGRGSMGAMGTQGDFTMVGYSSDSAMTSFLDGTCKITDGEMFTENTDENICIISEELALFNEISVGDKITLTNPNNEDETFKFTVCSIYTNSQSTTTTSEFMGGFSSANDPANQIYTSYTALKNLSEQSSENAETSTDETTGIETTTALREQEAGTYTFATVDDYNRFDTQARELGLEDSYTVSSSDLTAFEQSLVPLENLGTFAMYFLLVILIIGAIILVVMNIFNIRGRKYEVGVLTAIGMKKQKVALQFVTEIFAVTFIAIIIGTAIGAVISVPITNTLLETQISSEEQTQTQQEQNFGRPAGGMGQGGIVQGGALMDKENFMGGTVEYISSIESATNFTVVLQLLSIGLLLTILGSLAGILFIMRYEPLKILSNRD